MTLQGSKNKGVNLFLDTGMFQAVERSVNAEWIASSFRHPCLALIKLATKLSTITHDSTSSSGGSSCSDQGWKNLGF